MRKVFSSNEIGETSLVRDALVQHGIAVTIQNEYSGSSAVPGFRPPAELWVDRDEEYEIARGIVTEALAKMDSNADGAPWTCSSCEEQNPQSFDLCWSCGRDKSPAGDRAREAQ